MDFATKPGCKITSIKADSTEFINQTAQGDSALWRLVLLGPDGVNPSFLPANSKFQGATLREDTSDKITVVLTWQLRPAKNVFMPVRVLIEAQKDCAYTTWNFECDVPNNWSVHQVEFPRFIHIDTTASSDLYVPSGWGLAYPFAPGYVFEGTYPSCLQGMQFIMVQQKTNDTALYVGTHDPNACLKTFRAKGLMTTGELSVDIPASSQWSPKEGGTFRLPWDTIIGIHSAGWQGAVVDWYRPFTYTTPWGKKKFDAAKVPQWLLNADLWLRPMFATEETREGLHKALDYFGTDVALHWYRWHEIEYDVDYPEYFPPKTTFPPMVKEAQERGTHVVPYINGRLWDPGSNSWATQNGNQLAARKFDGTLYTEVYGSMIANAVACPSTKEWRSTISGLVNRLISDIGVDGVYIDQICAASGVPCYADNHEHAPGGGSWWHEAYRKLLTETRNAMPSKGVLTTEENAECFMDLFDFLLLVNTPLDGSKPVPMWSHIYSDRCIMYGFQYYTTTEPHEDAMSFMFKNTLSLLWGSQIGWIQPDRMVAPGCEAQAEFLRELARFRRNQHDLIYGGRFLGEVFPNGDNPEMHNRYLGPWDGVIYPLITPAVRGALWEGPAGNKGVMLVNLDSKDHQVTLPAELGAITCTVKAHRAIRVDV